MSACAARPLTWATAALGDSGLRRRHRPRIPAHEHVEDRVLGIPLAVEVAVKVINHHGDEVMKVFGV